MTTPSTSAQGPVAGWLTVTDDQINSACLSYRHDFGLMEEHDRQRLRWEAQEWLHAWRKEADPLAPALTATPAPTSGSEDGGGPYTCTRCLSDTWNDDDICDDCKSEADSLAKPASEPAGGDVVDAVRDAVRSAIVACHDKGYGVAMSANAEQAFVNALLLTIAALSSSAGPAVVAVSLADLDQWRRDWLDENDPKDGTDCVTPFDAYLYAHPAPATVEMREDALFLAALLRIDTQRAGIPEIVRDHITKAAEMLAALAPATEGRKS